MSDFSHIDSKGNPQMVDVSDKETSPRIAKARSRVRLGSKIMTQLSNGDITTKKGPVFSTAIISGVMAAKKTAELIPFCHPIGLDDCSISISPDGDNVEIICTAKVIGKTGVEMEALTGATIAALTVYDMCKALSHDIEIVETRLLEKTGGKSEYKFEQEL